MAVQTDVGNKLTPESFSLLWWPSSAGNWRILQIIFPVLKKGFLPLWPENQDSAEFVRSIGDTEGDLAWKEPTPAKVQNSQLPEGLLWGPQIFVHSQEADEMPNGRHWDWTRSNWVCKATVKNFLWFSSVGSWDEFIQYNLSGLHLEICWLKSSLLQDTICCLVSELERSWDTAPWTSDKELSLETLEGVEWGLIYKESIWRNFPEFYRIVL